MVERSTTSVEIVRIDQGTAQARSDLLASEEPLEIRLETPGKGGAKGTVSITMRTPGHDQELAAGFLVTEGVLDPWAPAAAQVGEIKNCGPKENVVRVVMKEGVAVDWDSLRRNFYMTSSCGVCGKASIDALRVKSGGELAARHDPGFRVPLALIPGLPEGLRKSQDVFSATGGLHASGLFDAKGALEVLREDVGRHNALDKVIGWAFLAARLPLSRTILVLSGRISFELVQKAAMAGIPVIAAVGAPSSLALELAREARITLVGFVRGERFNIYHDEGRLI
jgi:FdhD protein